MVKALCRRRQRSHLVSRQLVLKIANSLSSGKRNDFQCFADIRKVGGPSDDALKLCTPVGGWHALKRQLDVSAVLEAKVRALVRTLQENVGLDSIIDEVGLVGKPETEGA